MEHSISLSNTSFRPRITGVGILAIALSIWGCIAIYNATSDVQPSYLFTAKQLAWLPVGIAVLVILTSLNPQLFRRGAIPAALIMYITLWLVLYYGVQVNGMRGWFNFFGIFLQPSEIGKPIFVLLIAAVFAEGQRRQMNWPKAFVILLAVLGGWLIPIALQPDFGAILLYTAVFLGICWCVGCPARYIGGTAVLTSILGYFIVRWTPYVWERFYAFLNPQDYPQTAGWHVMQFQNVITSGDLTGNTFTVWSDASSFLPVAYSDSIFACTAGSFGYIGVVPLIILLGGWLTYGFWQTLSTENIFRKTVLAGCTLMLGIQALLHLSINLGLFPVTGLTLPLISYGGSSLVATMATVGILEAAAYRTQADDRQ